MKTILKIAITTLCILIYFSNSVSAHYGPRGLVGGTITCGIKASSGLIYLGTAEGGVYVTTNTTHSAWRLRAVGLKSGKIKALTDDGYRVYTATADSGIYVFNGAIGSDLFWNPINTGLTTAAFSSLLAVDSSLLLAGSNGNGLFKTTNGGTSWSAISSPLLNGQNVTGLVKAGNRIIAITASGGVFKSDDEGDSWSDFNDANTLNISNTRALSYNNLTDELLVLNQYGLFALSAASTNNSPSYSTLNSGLPLGVNVKNIANNGAHWYLASNWGVYTAGSSFSGWAAENNGLPTMDVTAIVTTDTSVFAGMHKKGVAKSAVNTINWASNNTSMSNVAVYALTCWGDSVVVTATEYGLMVSRNIAQNYVAANNGLVDSLNITDVQFAGNILFVTTKNAGVFISTDLGAVWTPVNGGLASLYLKKIFYANGRKYVLDNNGKLYESDLLSTTWTLSDTGLPANAQGSSMAFYGNKIFLGTNGNGVYVKDHFGTAWVAFNSGLSNQSVTSLTASAGKVFAGTAGSGVFVSDYASAAWTATAAIAIPHFNSVPINPNHIQYMTSYAGYIVASFRGGIVASSDAGLTWIPAGNQFHLPSYSDINKVAFVTSRIFVTTEQNSGQSNNIAEIPLLNNFLEVDEQSISAPIAGITSYHSITSNLNWQVSSNQAWATVNVSSGSRNGNIEIVAQPNSGAPRTAQITVTGDSTNQVVINITQDGVSALESVEAATVVIYPNPSNGDFNIDLGQLSNVQSIDIFDALGKKVETVLTEGQNIVPVKNITHAGIYMVRIQAAGQTIVKTVIVR